LVVLDKEDMEEDMEGLDADVEEEDMEELVQVQVYQELEELVRVLHPTLDKVGRMGSHPNQLVEEEDMEVQVVLALVVVEE
jgi:hypothetical protein